MLRSLFFLGATASLLLLASTAVSVHGAEIALGAVCGNADTCVAGSICYANYCIKDAADGATNNTGAVPAGAGNRCSADDCCGADLVCVEVPGDAIPRLCIWKETQPLDGVGLTNVVECTGQPGPAPNLDDGKTPDLSESNSTIPDGTAQSCESNNCCPSDLVCYQLGKVCGPATSSLPTIACTGQPPVADGNSDPLNIPTGNECGNTEATKCPNGDICLANYCVSPPIAGVDAINSLGNRCASDNCCPNGLACASAIKRCSINIGGLSYDTCTATGGPSSGETVGPQSGNPQPIGAASTIQASPLVALLLAAAISLAKLW